MAAALTESKVLESVVEGAGALGVTAVRFYLFKMEGDVHFHIGWGCVGNDAPATPARYVGRYAVEDNALRDTVVQVRVYFKDQDLWDVKIKKPQPVEGEVPASVLTQAAGGV